MTDQCFWREAEDDVHFPLHFTIEVLGASAAEADILYVTISGADRELELQKPLEPIGNTFTSKIWYECQFVHG